MLEIGRVIHIHIRDDLVDPEKMYVRTENMRLIGRMHGRGWYARTSDLFLMDRLDLESREVKKTVTRHPGSGIDSLEQPRSGIDPH
jgi:hypothetical protein